ncbi:MAG: trimeric autotransporter adhesin [Verrucomicrobiota bacterium]
MQNSPITSRHSPHNISNLTLTAVAALLLAASTTNLCAATFSDDNWSSIGNIQKDGPLPHQGGGVGPVVTDSSGKLYVGGDFTIAGGVAATNIAKWNGINWSALDSGVNGSVGALLAVGNELYAGGQFTTAGGVSATNIARWNGSHWSPLGSGMSSQPYYLGYVGALAMSGSDLYAAGYFTNAGGSPANYIAKWNGSGWSALGSGMDDVVQALAVSGSNVYAGGHFTTAGGSSANYIAKWNGSSWSALGSGMDAPVYSLAVMGSDLYAGGYFKTAGGVSATNIARWDGTDWSPVGAGIHSLFVGNYSVANVTGLAVSDNDLYAAGNFGVEASDYGIIAKWNGSSWSALGSGMNDELGSLAVLGSDLYAGGSFTRAGAKHAEFIAKARVGSSVRSIVATNSTATIQCSGVSGYQYDAHRTTSLTPPVAWTTITTNPLYPAPDGTLAFTDTNMPPGNAFYRARLLAPTP